MQPTQIDALAIPSAVTQARAPHGACVSRMDAVGTVPSSSGSHLGTLRNNVDWHRNVDQTTSTIVDRTSHTPVAGDSSPPTEWSPTRQQPNTALLISTTIGQLIEEMRRSIEADYENIGSQFASELKKIQNTHQQRFESIASQMRDNRDLPDESHFSTESNNSGDHEKPMLFSQVGKAESESPTPAQIPFESSPSGNYPAQMSEQTSASSTQRPRSPLAAMVTEVIDEDNVRTSRPPAQTAPVPHPFTRIRDDPIWRDCVNSQRIHNQQHRENNYSSILDQGIGFDEDNLPVDKATMP
ncbi:hypothetical protein L218DRAFT_1026263 [Marasmius fiardii PR-910]|nr:hypothetical protein L218DRAFT_1026263 [Marasmius fiardii PR-910]